MTPHASPFENPLTAYLRNLHRHKSTLPHGHLICVSASPNITTMSALLRLASAVGPFIAVLQVHADIIDDWSLRAAQRLTYLANKFCFLIWEGGRALNTQRRSGRTQSMSDEEITRSIDMARKRYTKGVVSVAAWAGLASTWVIGPEQEGRGADRLIPILRRAAKERVALMTKSVQTEISAGGGVHGQVNGTGMDDSEDSMDDPLLGAFSVSTTRTTTTEVETRDDLRKSSVISLTRTITQHTEVSTPSSTGEDEDDSPDTEQGFELESAFTPLESVPRPPLLSRGLIVCLPTDDDTRISPLYKKAAISAAKEHSDFVAGFLTDEAWVDVCKHRRFLNYLREAEPLRDHGLPDASQTRETFVVFSPLESGHVPAFEEDEEVVDEDDDHNRSIGSPPLDQQRGSSSSTQARQINSLHDLVARALATRDASVSSPPAEEDVMGRHDPEILYIPVISMNA